MTSGADVPTFEGDIKPLFREDDQKAMDFIFDLWDYQDVADNAQGILERVESGSMPCDGAWDADRVELFRCWIQAGAPR